MNVDGNDKFRPEGVETTVVVLSAERVKKINSQEFVFVPIQDQKSFENLPCAIIIIC